MAQPLTSTTWQAVQSRDARFDGRFFIGVKTTGVYCRTICPARPLRKNVVVFESREQAERAGYRPCLRCRPESSPASPAWMGKQAVVARGLRLLQNQTEPVDEDTFAAHFGMSARHLRRLFLAELGRTPKQLADHQRLDFARKLITETSLPFTDIAFAAGFRSLRRFNDAVQKRFVRSPTQLRRLAGRTAAKGVHLKLAYRPPLQWNAQLDFLRSHAIAGLEEVTATTYARVFEWAGHVGWLRVSNDPAQACLQLELQYPEARHFQAIVQHVRHMFDLDSDPLYLAQTLGREPTLRVFARRHEGMRIPRGWDPFETAVGAILGQLVSIAQARRLVDQLVADYGREVVHPETGAHVRLFPTPAVLAEAAMDEIGSTRARKNSVRHLAQAVHAGQIRLTLHSDFSLLREALLALPGIGAWTAEYICLRALGDTDAFPGTDLILKRALEQHPELIPENFRPWRGYVALWLWREYSQTLSKAKKGSSREPLSKENPQPRG